MTTDQVITAPKPPGAATAAQWLGIVSLVLGVCMGIGVLAAPFAVLFGVVGLTQCRDLELPGRDRAWFGIIAGSLIIVIVLAAVAVARS